MLLLGVGLMTLGGALLRPSVRGPLIVRYLKSRMEFYDSVRAGRSRILNGWLFPGGREREITRSQEERWAKTFFGLVLPVFAFLVGAMSVLGGLARILGFGDFEG